MKTPRTFSDVDSALRTSGMALPEVTEDFPWGHRALKVGGKVFVIIALDHGTLRFSAKLPESNAVALSMPFGAPTGYGLGRSGWVTATFSSPSQVPMPVLLSWLEESYRAIAPKRLSRLLPAQSLELNAHVAPPSPTPLRPPPAPRRKAK